MGGAVGRGGSVVGVEREQGGVADAGVDGDGSHARVRGEDGERQLGLGVGREARVAASAVGITPLDGAGAVQGGGDVDDAAARLAGERLAPAGW